MIEKKNERVKQVGEDVCPDQGEECGKTESTRRGFIGVLSLVGGDRRRRMVLAMDFPSQGRSPIADQRRDGVHGIVIGIFKQSKNRWKKWWW